MAAAAARKAQRKRRNDDSEDDYSASEDDPPFDEQEDQIHRPSSKSIYYELTYPQWVTTAILVNLSHQIAEHIQIVNTLEAASRMISAGSIWLCATVLLALGRNEVQLGPTAEYTFDRLFPCVPHGVVCLIGPASPAISRDRSSASSSPTVLGTTRSSSPSLCVQDLLRR